jgi:hypothetical protein
MDTIMDQCKDAVAFSYRSIDRLILNAYIPTLQTPGAMAWFFRKVQNKPILAGKVFKAITDRFVAAVKQFAHDQDIPVLPVKGRVRPGQVAQKALKAAASADRWGVVAIVVHQESARVFASTHAGGRATNFRVKEDRRFINYYYFYLRDRQFGDGFVRISSYPPFATRIWMNAHGYLAAQLRQRGIAFRADDNCIVEVADAPALCQIAEEFQADLVERIGRRWLGMVPCPLTPAEQAAGYSYRLSVYQAEFSDNIIFHKTQVLNRVYEQLLRDHLHLGRLDMVKVIFGRRIPKTTRSQFKTRILRQGVVSCLKVFFKKSFMKQYNKGGRVLRTEVCVNDPRDFGVRKSLVHLDYLGSIAHHALTRFLKAQAVALSTALDGSTFERMVMPSEQAGKRVAALRFGTPGTMRLLQALGCAGLTFRAFSNADLRCILVDRLAVPAAEVTSSGMSYQLVKLRGKGLIRKVKRRNLYTLTDLGYRVTLYLTKLHQRLLSPGLDALDRQHQTTLAESPHPLDRILGRLNTIIDELVQRCGLAA